MAVIMTVRGEIAMAIALPVIIIGYGLTVSLSAGRSDVAAQLSGHEEDERRRLINLRAGSMTGNVLMLALVCGTFYELARGEFGGTFTWLSALGGITYAASSAMCIRAERTPTADRGE
ncbi:hypothetical protein OG727_20000 [Streptomyces caniferus]|uniref:DUF2178 domain-containing protein n=1 Tax=Streptomyces caniferus TaxID=285557 RepID=A0ABZ1VNJ2_9ACTN|nr:hypothetical protein [Streptomyces caniferus]